MARFRLTPAAQTDIANILAASAEQWGAEGQQRYAALLLTAIHKIADEPDGPLTRRRRELRSGLRSFHIKHARRTPDARRVKRPVHILYYRVSKVGVLEIVRVLHERMEPRRHLEYMANPQDAE